MQPKEFEEVELAAQKRLERKRRLAAKRQPFSSPSSSSPSIHPADAYSPLPANRFLHPNSPVLFIERLLAPNQASPLAQRHDIKNKILSRAQERLGDIESDYDVRESEAERNGAVDSRDENASPQQR